MRVKHYFTFRGTGAARSALATSSAGSDPLKPPTQTVCVCVEVIKNAATKGVN